MLQLVKTPISDYSFKGFPDNRSDQARDYMIDMKSNENYYKIFLIDENGRI